MSDGDGVHRREVLKAGGAAAALGLGGSGFGKTLVEFGDDPKSKGNPGIESFVGQNEVIQTVCSPNCRGKCPIDVHVRDGQVKKVEPHPPEDERYKRACVLGLSHTQRAYDPTRLKYPMKRTDWSPDDPNGAGRGPDAEFERIEWDEALDLVAGKMQSLKSEHGAESVLFHEGSGNYGQTGKSFNRLASLFGATQSGWGIDANVGRGFNRVTGVGFFLPPTNEAEDWENANTIIVWGSDIFSSQFQMDASKILDAVENGAKLVVVDPVYTTTAAKADLWLPVKPGKDVYLALAMMHTVFEEGTYDEDFIRSRTTAPALIDKDTGELLRASEVFEDGSEDQVVAIEQGTEEPVALEPETGGPYALFGEYTIDGVEYVTALTTLKEHAAEYAPEKIAEKTGVKAQNIRTAARWLATRGPGGIAPSYALGRYTHGHIFGQAYAILMALTGDYGRSGNIHAHHSGGTVLSAGDWSAPEGSNPGPKMYFPDYPDSMLDGEPHKVRAVYSIESNMMGNQFPDRKKFKKAIESLEMYVVADMHHTDTVQHADIILPVPHWFEQEDIASGWGSHPHLGYRHKVQEPLWESKDDYYAVRGIAERLGYGDRFPETKREMLRELVSRDPDIDFETIFEQGTQRKQSVSVIKYTDAFPTQTGRLELYNEDPPSEKGVSFDLPRPVEDRTADDYEKKDQYPLMFMQKHSRFRIHSQYEMVNWVREVNPEPQLDIHPRDAKARGIDDGDYVRVYNERGEMVVKAKYNEAFQPGLVNTDQGWWSRDYVRGHHNDLTHNEVSEVGQTMAFYDVRVEVEPAPDADAEMYEGNNPRGADAEAPRAGGD
ncbi:molybdopterin-dependent oxidoreductase [Haloferax sp. YSSS75]|uniref:molybdopterin-dependent oxidoreductase n=1 Tax=Haloferax sp. YSSS75 TaxID=3388564 RepID=UPI00398C8AC2